MPVMREREWSARLAQAQHLLADARAAIDALSELADSEADLKICFAGNTLEGAGALLREADVAFRQEVRS
jgi:hypothetical protein